MKLLLIIAQTGSTPLCEASLAGSAEIVNTLLSAGARVDTADEVNPNVEVYMPGVTPAKDSVFNKCCTLIHHFCLLMSIIIRLAF